EGVLLRIPVRPLVAAPSFGTAQRQINACVLEDGRDGGVNLAIPRCWGRFGVKLYRSIVYVILGDGANRLIAKMFNQLLKKPVVIMCGHVVHSGIKKGFLTRDVKSAC